MTTEKNVLTNTRNLYLSARYSHQERLKLMRIEKKYGKYLYLPYDVPRIEPTDAKAFVNWYGLRAKSVNKIANDIAGSAYAHSKNFLSVNSPNQIDRIWEMNPVHDLFSTFPEIERGIRNLPFSQSISAVPQFSIWSSQRQVMLHRDQNAFEDFPASFRVMLYDSNPEPTLFLRERPPENWQNTPLLPLKRHETNVFGWNNLRTLHGSSHNPKYTKMLLIFTSVKFDLDKLEDLLERSAQKYGAVAHVSSCKYNDFVNN